MKTTLHDHFLQPPHTLLTMILDISALAASSLQSLNLTLTMPLNITARANSFLHMTTLIALMPTPKVVQSVIGMGA